MHLSTFYWGHSAFAFPFSGPPLSLFIADHYQFAKARPASLGRESLYQGWPSGCTWSNHPLCLCAPAYTIVGPWIIWPLDSSFFNLVIFCLLSWHLGMTGRRRASFRWYQILAKLSSDFSCPPRAPQSTAMRTSRAYWCRCIVFCICWSRLKSSPPTK